MFVAPKLKSLFIFFQCDRAGRKLLPIDVGTMLTSFIGDGYYRSSFQGTLQQRVSSANHIVDSGYSYAVARLWRRDRNCKMLARDCRMINPEACVVDLVTE
jgi:hypothetical protein